MLDKFHHGRTIKEWIEVHVKQQLKEYIEGPEVKKSVEDGLELRATMVVVIGSRHILLWNMLKGEFAEEPVLLGDRLVKKVASVSIEPVPKREKLKPVIKVLKKLQRKCCICGKPGHYRTTCPSIVDK